MPNWRKLIQSGSDAELNSLYVTNNISASGNIYADLTVQNSANIVTYNVSTGQLHYTASSGLGGGVAGVASLNELNGDLTISPGTGITINESSPNIEISASLNLQQVTNNGSTTTNTIYVDNIGHQEDIDTGMFFSADQINLKAGNVTYIDINNLGSTSYISMSSDVNITGLLHASTSYDDGTHTNVVVYDTASGRFYHTGSYGIGGSSLTGLDKQVVYFEGDNNYAGSDGFTFDYTTDSLYISGTYNGQRYASEGLNILDYKPSAGVVRLGDIDNEPNSIDLQLYGDAITDYNISSSADVYASGSRIVHLYHNVPRFAAASLVPFVGSNIATDPFKNSVEVYSTLHTSNSGDTVTLKIADLSTRINAADINIYVKFKGSSSDLAIMGFKISYARMNSGDGLVKLDYYKAYHGDASITGMIGGIQPQTVQSTTQIVDFKLKLNNIPFNLQGKDIEIVAKYDSHHIPFS